MFSLSGLYRWQNGLSFDPRLNIWLWIFILWEKMPEKMVAMRSTGIAAKNVWLKSSESVSGNFQMDRQQGQELENFLTG